MSGYVTFFYLDSNRVSGFNPFNILNLVQKGEVGIQQRGDLAAIEQALRDRTHDKIPADYDYGSSFKIALLHHHVSCPAAGDMGAELSELRDSRQVLEVLSQMGIALVR